MVGVRLGKLFIKCGIYRQSIIDLVTTGLKGHCPLVTSVKDKSWKLELITIAVCIPVLPQHSPYSSLSCYSCPLRCHCRHQYHHHQHQRSLERWRGKMESYEELEAIVGDLVSEQPINQGWGVS